MSNIRRVIALMLVAAVFSLGAVGCKSGGKHNDDHPHGDHPKGDHPKH